VRSQIGGGLNGGINFYGGTMTKQQIILCLKVLKGELDEALNIEDLISPELNNFADDLEDLITEAEEDE